MADSRGQTVAANPLLETKLFIPRWRPGLVPRARLIERLNQGTERKLTLISAPAGFGKTMLLAEWLAATQAGERPAAWVSLDQSDNDPALFWAYFIVALHTVRSGVGESALSLLRSPQPPPIESVLTTLINEINEIEDDFALILDDFHVIDGQPVHSAIAFLLDHLPPQMHLVVASRSDPPLPLARLRGRGELTELRAADLRFTPSEAAAFLNEVMGLDLSAADVAALETRTEGQEDGKGVLNALERGNLFVVPLDDKRQWYRYHHLFGDVLQAHSMEEQSDLQPALHRRASEWYEQNGLPADAVRHALAAEDFERAAGLVELAVPTMRRSRQDATLLGWLKALPDDGRPEAGVGEPARTAGPGGDCR